MHEVSAIGVGVTKFGRLDAGLMDLLSEASTAALRDSGTEKESFDSIFVANMSSGEFVGIAGIANALVSELALEPAFSCKVENTSGSGGAAFYTGWMAVATGQSNLTLVVGGEKMTSVSGEEATDIIASISHEEEFKQGITLPSYAGLMAREYLQRYGAPREFLARIAVKNHANAMHNPNAQFHKPIDIETVLNSPVVADPLRLYDYCPISDGAAAVVLAPSEIASTYVEKPGKVMAVAGATDTHVIHEREEMVSMKAVRLAGEKAYRMAGIGPDRINVAEVHDMATILEVVQCEELGFFRKGLGWKAVEEGATQIGGRLPVNTSGGLKAKGHPLGATGVAQACEIVQQLQGRCGGRQVDARLGLACNVGGFGNNAVVSILGR